MNVDAQPWRTNLTTFAVYATLALSAQANKTNVVETTILELARLNGLTKWLARKALNELEQCGVVETENRSAGRGSTMKITIIDVPEKQTQTKKRDKKTEKSAKSDNSKLCYLEDWQPTPEEHAQYMQLCEGDEAYYRRQVEDIKIYFIDGKGRNVKRRGWHRTVVKWINNAKNKYNDRPTPPGQKTEQELIEEVRQAARLSGLRLDEFDGGVQ